MVSAIITTTSYSLRMMILVFQSLPSSSQPPVTTFQGLPTCRRWAWVGEGGEVGRAGTRREEERLVQVSSPKSHPGPLKKYSSSIMLYRREDGEAHRQRLIKSRRSQVMEAHHDVIKWIDILLELQNQVMVFIFEAGSKEQLKSSPTPLSSSSATTIRLSKATQYIFRLPPINLVVASLLLTCSLSPLPLQASWRRR